MDEETRALIRMLHRVRNGVTNIEDADELRWWIVDVLEGNKLANYSRSCA